ncbi:chemotaxis protein CheW [Ectothiorhodospiraceae bacterium BW-2]|nr:chemotaxis protein CheW [Ectothiorhodospiraceae bacterium BW-2]
MTTQPIVAGIDSSLEQLRQRGDNQQFLTFTLGEESYAVDILRVQEIKGWSPVTHIPNTPDYLRGVLNLRGTIVPIIDLRMRFQLQRVEYTPVTVVIVLSVASGEKPRTLGIVVDGVSDVLTVATDDIKPTPDFGGPISTEYIHGLVSINEQMIMLLDIDLLLSIAELRAIDNIKS